MVKAFQKKKDSVIEEGKRKKQEKEKMKLTGQQGKLIKKVLERMGDDAGTFMTTITEVVGKKGMGPAGQRVREVNKKTKGTSGALIEPARPSPKGKLTTAKGGGLMEATANLKARGMKEGGMVVKEKTVAMDKSPNSGLITTKGFGVSRRT